MKHGQTYFNQVSKSIEGKKIVFPHEVSKSLHITIKQSAEILRQKGWLRFVDKKSRRVYYVNPS